MTDHPSIVELEGLLQGTLAGERLRFVVRHFLHGCPDCVRAISPQVAALLGPRRPISGRPSPLSAPLPRSEGEAATPLTAYQEFDLLLKRCRSLREAHPSKLSEMAARMVEIASTMNPRTFGGARVRDFQCQAWIEVANAHRIQERFIDAESALRQAASHFTEGTQAELLEARLLEIRAALHADRSDFPAAAELLDTVYQIYRRHNDEHLAGQTLLAKGLIVGTSGDFETAIRLTHEGLSLIDCDRNPRLVFVGVHNLSCWLVDAGRFEEARLLLHTFQSSVRRYAKATADRLRMRWVRAEVAAGLGELTRAEKGLLHVREGFRTVNMPYKASLVALELAMVYLRQGRSGEARAHVLDAVETLTALGIHKEAFLGVLLLRRAFEQEVTSCSFLQGLVGFLRRAEDNPSVSLQDWLQK